MKLLKIRDQIINIDLLQCVTLGSDAITLFLAGKPYRFTGEEAGVLKEWLERYAFDLLNYQAMSIEREIEGRAPIEPLRKPVTAGGLFRTPFALK